MWQGIQLNLSPLLTHFWPDQVWNRQLCNPTQTHTPTRACTQTHTHANALKYADTRHAQMSTHACTCRHSTTLSLTCRDTSCVCVYSHFPHLAFLSCHIAIVLLPLAVLIDFLFLWAVANVTFPAGAHTLMLSTASHPGYKNTGSSPGVSCMEKKCPSLHVTHSLVFHAAHRDTLYDKGAVSELRGRLHRCSKIVPVTSGTGDDICTGMFTHPYSTKKETRSLPQVK